MDLYTIRWLDVGDDADLESVVCMIAEESGLSEAEVRDALDTLEPLPAYLQPDRVDQLRSVLNDRDCRVTITSGGD